MTAPPVPALLPGRVLALLGILLVALNVRDAVSALSPIVVRIGADVPLDELGLGIIGMLPPVFFALTAIAAPPIARRIGLEPTIVIACAAMIAGPLMRGLAPSYGVLVAGSALALAGLGLGNVLLPPAVKKYFPDRIGSVTAAYVTLMAISTTLGAALAEPVAAVAGWRISLGMWSLLGIAALVPWVLLLVNRRRRPSDAAVLPEIHTRPPVWRSSVAWSLMVLLMATAFPTYAMFAWLPTLLSERAGLNAVDAGNLFALFTIIGLPLSLIVPAIAGRFRNVSWIIWLGVVSIVIFGLGLLFAPTTLTWLWVAFGGLGGVLFPLCLVLINLRTRTTEGSIAVSGFIQSVAYGFGAIGPLVLAITHDLTGEWIVPILIVVGVGMVGVLPAITLARPVFVEDQLDARAA